MRAELGGCRVERLVGRGASAEAWLAWSPDRPEPVVLKRAVAPDGSPGGAAPARLRQEAAVLARVRHAGVVALLDVVDDPPGVALVLEHLEGGSLRDLLAERGTLLAGELVALLEPVAAACTALAALGLVHGDLKPEHVCFTAAGAPVLVDLGAATVSSEPAPGALSATPAYLDPAVAAGAAPGARSEVFALAVVAYEALTGRLPHRGDAAHAVAAAAAGSHRSLRSWPAVPSAVADVVERALDPHPERRPADPAAFAAALRAVVAREEVVPPGPARRHRAVPPGAPTGPSATVRFGPAPPAPVAAPVPARRGRVAALGAVAVAGALVAGASLVDRPDARGGPPAPTAADAPCPSVLPPPPPGRLLAGDLDGDGCADAARWDGATLVAATAAGGRAFRVAAPGAQLVLGDWDGDGTDTPGLYDPATGAARLVDRLPGPVGQGLGPSRVVALAPGGRAEVSPGAGPGEVDEVRVRAAP